MGDSDSSSLFGQAGTAAPASVGFAGFGQVSAPSASLFSSQPEQPGPFGAPIPHGTLFGAPLPLPGTFGTNRFPFGSSPPPESQGLFANPVSGGLRFGGNSSDQSPPISRARELHKNIERATQDIKIWTRELAQLANSVTPTCPRGHELVQISYETTPPGGRFCDKCTRVSFTKGMKAFECRACNYDMCAACREHV